MALDWNKEISFSGLAKSASAARKDEYPTKRYMNFVAVERRKVNLKRVVPLGILGVVVLALVLKFGVFDFVGQIAQKNAEIDRQRQDLAAIEQNLTNYDSVLSEYQSYVSTQLASDATAVDGMSVLALIDEVVTPKASIASLDYKDNVLTLNLFNTSLANVGELANELDDDPLVESVTVSTAAAGQSNENDVTVAMTVTLTKGVA